MQSDDDDDELEGADAHLRDMAASREAGLRAARQAEEQMERKTCTASQEHRDHR